MVEVFYYDAFQKTINPEPEGGPLVRHSAFAELEAENERLREENMAMEMAHAAGSALASTGAVKVKALEHEQWSVIDRAIERYTNGEISDLHALGLITAGFLKLDAERVAASRVLEGGKS